MEGAPLVSRNETADVVDEYVQNKQFNVCRPFQQVNN